MKRMRYFLVALISAVAAMAAAAHAAPKGPQPADWTWCKFELRKFCPDKKTQQEYYDCLQPHLEQLSQSCKTEGYAKFEYLLNKNGK